MAKVTLVGAGMMGSALSVPFADNGHTVRLVGTHLDGDIVDALRAGAPHPTLREPLPDGVAILPVEALGDAMRDAEVIGIGVSSAGVPWVAEAIGPHLRPGVPLLMITKGLDGKHGSLQLLPDSLAAALPATSMAPVAVAGPCIAGELARRVPTCVVFTGRDVTTARLLADLARNDYYHPVVEPDVVGAEVSAALKNAYAMGIALAQGVHEARGGSPASVAMHNYESAVFAQAVLEMQRLVVALGGDPATPAGLAGVGDLDVTCNGGRTGRFGRLLGLGIGRDEAIRRMSGATLECLEILAVVRAALPSLEARGDLAAGALPLMEHLAEVALDGAPVDMPFSRFFGGAG